MEKQNQLFIISLLVVVSLTAIITFIPIWQLIIIPGIFAGLFNKSLKKAVLAGVLGVSLYWLLYILDGILFEDIYPLFDQFGALILSAGFGWLLIILILIFGVLFGLFGAFIGNKTILIIRILMEKKSTKRT